VSVEYHQSVILPIQTAKHRCPRKDFLESFMSDKPRTHLTYETVIDGVSPTALIDNSHFLPRADAGPARHQLSVSLQTRELPMSCSESRLSSSLYAGRRADLFPGVTLDLVSDGDDLIPVERDLLRAPQGESFWDLAVAPGQVWSEPGDRGMSRAVLPFLLCNELENDTHHGLVCFLFDDKRVSPWQMQIAIETKPFVIPFLFDAWATVNVVRTELDCATVAPNISAFQVEKREQHVLKPLSALPGDVAQALFADLDRGVGADTTVVHGLIVDDIIYSSACHTRAGDYPLLRAMQMGLWSATKTAFGTIACLRLAQSTGEDCRSAIVADLIPEASVNPRWNQITIADCLNMATSIGTLEADPNTPDVFADYVLEEERCHESAQHRQSFDHYFDWFLAYPRAEKNRHAFSCASYPWAPGQVARYRDQDLYIAGVAMDAWLKRKRGPDARLWDMVRDEVYEPCGLRHAINFQTRESNQQEIVPLTDAGLLLSLDNIACLARLLHDGGLCNGDQILDPSLLAEVFDPSVRKGLPTGMYTTDGEQHYHFGTWHLPYISPGGELFWLPTMSGHGGQKIQLLPNGMTAFRFAYDDYSFGERFDALKLARIADAIRPFSA